MKVSLQSLRERGEPLTMIIHSLEQALYQVTVIIDGGEALVTEDNGSIFRRHSLNAAREALQTLPVARLTLRHTSAYDEMIGQPPRDSDNVLEVSLSLEDWTPTATGGNQAPN